MRRLSLLSLIFFIAGLSFLIQGILEGELKGGFFLIFPFLFGSGIYSSLGIFMIFLGILFLSLDILTGLTEDFGEIEQKREGGAVVMIGPIPIVLATSLRIAFILFFVAILVMLLLLFILLS